MVHQLTKKPHPRLLKSQSHWLLAVVLVGCAIALWLSPTTWRVIGPIAATAIALHTGVAVAVHLGMALAGGGVVYALWMHARRRHNHGEAAGATLHSPRFYDWLAAVYCVGREGQMRERTLDLANVAAGEHVLDICCGTGTLAVAARRRVGATGSVHGVDASEEMIAHARTKSARRGLPVVFDVAAAQALPFTDATFDVAFCSLALHHLPEDARAKAVEEMRRVVKPAGRVLIVEFSRGRGASTLLHPVALLHRRKAQILDGVADLMKWAGLERVVTGQLGFAGLGYALAHRE